MLTVSSQELNDRMYGFTPRQREIMHCFLDGFSHKETAAKLRITVTAVRSHLWYLRGKGDLPHTLTGLVSWLLLPEGHPLRAKR